MAVKVKILSVLLFICLIDSLHSASYRRMKRDAEEATEAPEKPESSDKTENSGSESESSTKKSWIDNIGQIINVKKSPDWMEAATAWFNNAPSMFGNQKKN